MQQEFWINSNNYRNSQTIRSMFDSIVEKIVNESNLDYIDQMFKEHHKIV